MGRLNPIVGHGMAARLVLFRANAEDDATVAPSAFDGERVRIAPGVWEYRKEGYRVFVVWKVKAALANDGVRYVLAVVYTPGPTRDAQAVFTQLVADIGAEVVKSWPVVLNADGTLRVPALDSDATAVGTRVKAALWPDAWRVRLPADAEGALPSGPRCLAEVLA